MTSWQIQQQQEGNAPNPAWNNNSFEYRCANYVVQDPLLKVIIIIIIYYFLQLIINLNIFIIIITFITIILILIMIGTS